MMIAQSRACNWLDRVVLLEQPEQGERDDLHRHYARERLPEPRAGVRVGRVCRLIRVSHPFASEGFQTDARLTTAPRLLSARTRRQHVANDPRLLRIMIALMTFRRTRSFRPSNVTEHRKRADRRPETWLHICPRAHVLWLLLRPYHLFDVRIHVDDRRQIARPRRQFLAANDRDRRRPFFLGEEVVWAQEEPKNMGAW